MKPSLKPFLQAAALLLLGMGPTHGQATDPAVVALEVALKTAQRLANGNPVLRQSAEDVANQVVLTLLEKKAVLELPTEELARYTAVSTRREFVKQAAQRMRPISATAMAGASNDFISDAVERAAKERHITIRGDPLTSALTDDCRRYYKTWLPARSAQESLVWELHLNGMSVRQIAKQLSATRYTVGMHLKSATASFLAHFDKSDLRAIAAETRGSSVTAAREGAAVKKLATSSESWQGLKRLGRLLRRIR